MHHPTAFTRRIAVKYCLSSNCCCTLPHIMTFRKCPTGELAGRRNVWSLSVSWTWYSPGTGCRRSLEKPISNLTVFRGYSGALHKYQPVLSEREKWQLPMDQWSFLCKTDISLVLPQLVSGSINSNLYSKDSALGRSKLVRQVLLMPGTGPCTAPKVFVV